MEDKRDSDGCRNNNNSNRGKHVDNRTLSLRDASQGRIYFFHAVLLGWFGKYATSVSRARLTALSGSIVHACTLCVYTGLLFQSINAVLCSSFRLFPSVSVFNCDLFIIILLTYSNLYLIQSHNFQNRRQIKTDMGENTSSRAQLQLSASSWN